MENFRISFIFLPIYNFKFLYNLLTINIIKNLNGKNNQNNNKSKIWKNSGKSENIDHLKMKLDMECLNKTEFRKKLGKNSKK